MTRMAGQILKPYAGVGWRFTPPDVQDIMTAVAQKLESEGWLLRSGGASGADQAFQRGVQDPSHMQIFLPSQRFPRENPYEHGQPGIWNYQRLPQSGLAMGTVDEFHPAPQRLTPFVRHLMARNAMQVLGPQMNNPAKMVVAYTKSGGIEGGTGQALRIAEAHGIPVKNLGNPATMESVLRWLE